MPRISNLRFTQQQEEDLVVYLMESKASLEANNADRIKTDREAWQRYLLDVKLRSNSTGNIWRLSNLTVPVFAMIIEHFVSRSEDTVIGDKPYFHFEAVGNSDERKIQLYDRYFNWKLDDQAKVYEALQDKQPAVYIQKASIQKAVFERKVSRWIDREKKVLFDKQTNEAVEILDYGPVVEDEAEWLDQVDPIAPTRPAGVPGMPDEINTRKHLKADPSLVMDEARYEWRLPPDGLAREEVVYAGPKSENVRFDHFLCPMDAASVEAADRVCELCDKPLTWIRENWLERPWATWASVQTSMRNGDATEKTTQREPAGAKIVSNQLPENRTFDRLNPVRRVWEFWVRRDVLNNGEGEPQEFVAFLDPDLRKLIYYEYQAKVCPDFKRPYTVTSLGKVQNSWCGISIWEKGKEIFDSIDRLWNGEFYRTLQQANPPKGGDPTVAEEEPDDIVYDPTKYYKLKPGKIMEQLLSYAKVPDTNQRSQMVLEYMVFWLQLWLGISNIAQGDYASVPENSTKYGIQKVLQESAMLGRRWIRRVISADEEHLTKLTLIALATLPQNQKETFDFADGDTRQVAELDATEIRSLKMHVQLRMAQSHEEQMVERSNVALSLQEKYFLQLSPEVRDAMRPLMLEVLTNLGYKDAEALLPTVQAMPLHPSMMGGEPLQNAALAGAAPPVAPNVAGAAPETAPAAAPPAPTSPA